MRVGARAGRVPPAGPPLLRPLDPPADLRERRVQAGDVELFVRTWGDGPPLYLVHGGPGGSGSYWPTTLPDLGATHRVVAVDLRGHGRSERRAPYRIERFARDLTALREALSHPRAALLGHSYGALVALQAAAQDEAFDQLVLVGGFPRTWRMLMHPRGFGRKLRLGARVAAWNLRERAGRRVDIREYLRDLLDGAAPLMHRPGAPAWWDDLLFSSAVEPLDPIVPMQYDLVRWDASRWMSRVRAPTLVLLGEHDAIAAPEAHRLAEGVPGAQLVVMEDAGHTPFLDDPQGFREILRGFLQ